MKRCLIVLAVVATSIPAMAQFFGLPVAENAKPGVQGAFSLGGGGTFGEYDDSDVTMYGGRIGYNLTDGFKVFGDVGMVEVEDADAEAAFQGGFLYAIPVQGDIPLAIRGTVGMLSYEETMTEYYYMYRIDAKADLDLMTYTLALLTSMDMDPMSIYAGAGVVHTTVDMEASASALGYTVSVSESDSETDPMVLVGTKFALNANLSIYGEVAFIDGVNVGAGIVGQF